MGSFFGTQEGDFSLTVKSICALDEAPAPPPRSLPPAVEEDSKVADPRVLESGLPNSSDQPNRPGEFTLRIFGVCLLFPPKSRQKLLWRVLC